MTEDGGSYFDCLSFDSATLGVCIREVSELGSESNPIVISDSEPLGSPSNPIIIHYEDYDSGTHGLPVLPWSDADTEIISSPEFWLGVENPAHTDAPNKGLGLELEPIRAAPPAYSGSERSPIPSQQSQGALLNKDGTELVVSALQESTTEDHHAEQQTRTEILDEIPADEIPPSACSGSEQSQAVTKPSREKCQIANVEQTRESSLDTRRSFGDLQDAHGQQRSGRESIGYTIKCGGYKLSNKYSSQSHSSTKSSGKRKKLDDPEVAPVEARRSQRLMKKARA